jgi:O-6-methylguanine DNA methyltransferase
MQKSLKYMIFRTKWGYFGLSGMDNILWRTCLPLSEPEKVKLEILKSRYNVALKSSPVRGSNLTTGRRKKGSNGASIEYRVSSIKRDKNLFKALQEQIIAYFEGVCVNFSRSIPVELGGFSSFTHSVLTTCRDIKFGQTINYSTLAKKLGRSAAARAVGNALAKNPLPLIIPCHRVIRSDGVIGGFSAPGGKNLKVKLLQHEHTRDA